MTIGSVIAERRKRSGFTQEQFADKLGVARQTVSSWENDIFIPDTSKIMQIALIFSCTTDELLNHQESSGERTITKKSTVPTK